MHRRGPDVRVAGAQRLGQDDLHPDDGRVGSAYFGGVGGAGPAYARRRSEGASEDRLYDAVAGAVQRSLGVGERAVLRPNIRYEWPAPARCAGAGGARSRRVAASQRLVGGNAEWGYEAAV